MEAVQSILAILLLLAALVLHGISLFNGSTFESSKAIYEVQGAHKELQLPTVYRMFGYFTYLIYFLGISLSWSVIIPSIHYIFMSIACIRFFYIIYTARRIKAPLSYEETSVGREVDRIANIAGTLHILYVFFHIVWSV